MRLINAHRGQLEEFLASNITLYVILPHTWGDGEVTFPSFHEHVALGLEEYNKII
jgi:hypothetical protein